MRIIGFIPARFASTRFPGKPLVHIAGKPMIQWVYEHVSEAELLDRVIVLTDDKEISKVVRAFDGEVMMTSKNCASGTERIVSVLKKYPCDIAINIQGDEPLLKAYDIDMLVRSLMKDKQSHIATLVRSMKDKESIHNPNVVKVVVDHNDHALYFSRSVIPYAREKGFTSYLQHIGLYAYRTTVLKKLHTLKQRKLEYTEKLEQLRFLENGYHIKVVYTEEQLIGVDTVSDLRLVETILRT